MQLEASARHAYISHKALESVTVSIGEPGLFVSADYPFLAARTDGIVSDPYTNDTGILEIKCPVGNKMICDLAMTRKHFFLKVEGNGALSLRKSYVYYTQVQLLMAVTGHQWAGFGGFLCPRER